MCNIQGSDLCAYTPDQCWAPTAGGEVGEQSLQQALHYYNIYIYTHYHSILQVLSHDYPHHTIFIPIILYIFAVVIFGATINCIMEVENNPL